MTKYVRYIDSPPSTMLKHVPENITEKDMHSEVTHQYLHQKTLIR